VSERWTDERAEREWQKHMGEDPSSDGAGPTGCRRMGDVDGAAFALDAPSHVAAVWGSGTDVLWPESEPIMLYGPDGVGKTTLAQQLVLRCIGLGDGLLGYPVRVAEGKVLYLALDRPRQAARSMHRMVTEHDRALLTDRLVVWQGSVPFDVLRDPSSVAAFALERGASTVVIDSLKDLAPKLSDEETGDAVHKAWQACVEAGLEVASLHHPRKPQAGNKKPRTLADVYGSRWLTAGCGSVILLWGDAGDPVVELEHLKQPADVVGPLQLLHDNYAGATTVIDTKDVVAIVKGHIGPDPPTARDVAAVMFGKPQPSRNEIEKARRRLIAAVRDGRLEERTVPTVGGEGTGYAPV
jgi:replicative DNA helicase